MLEDHGLGHTQRSIKLATLQVHVDERHIDEAVLVLSRQGMQLRKGRVFIADGNAFFNRPGPRIVETAEILASILHGVPAFAAHAGANYISVGSRKLA